ncbi:hypothetical protein AKG08_04400 [Achromobacter piechaudii]|uniref:DUF4123 domain-containing protein n=1 Tax=Achromobacter piechaudii TaxID=72556 RepID=A0ABN7F0D5_9BURK|nr:DUF4123 domain-containing protein [Achromobacter piechaudii]KNY12673.1 hypothetical protein AKG08_04400 [Achromobacter piechaudii]CAB3708266.1 hypothetical protein LMG1873_03018 [Achromobacter piechaudii]CAB3873670.1 hypothetical protein LMG2828_03102 [Achromobacter piechaudii]CAB3953812.1 hypothetical protein LMG6103_03980 [Achromobacter piechaudii]
MTKDLTPTRADAAVEHAIAGLRAVLDARPNRRVLLLCDSTLDDPLAEEFASAGLARRAVDLISQGASAPPLYLVEVPDEIRHERLINASIRLAVDEAMRPAPAVKRARSMSAWLATDLPLAEVADRLILRARLRDAQGRMRILRFWDPRTTQFQSELYAGCAPASWIAGATWMSIDGFARWQALPDAPGPMQTATPDWPRLARLGQINAVLQRLNVDGLASGPSLLEPIRRALDAGAACGMDDEDVALFAAWRVRLDAPLERAPAFATLLREIQEEGGRLRNAAQDMDDEDWQVFAWQAQAREDRQA